MKKFQISNFKCQLVTKSTRGNGFTLVEMLAVIAIFVVIGTVIMSILVSSFRTANKSNIITLVQQNGNYALSQMAKTIRNARGLVDPIPCAPSVTQNSISILTSDNQEVTYACTSGSSATIASNGASLLDTGQVKLSSCSFTCTQESASDLPFILVDFSLTQKSSSTFAEQLASQSAVEFRTSISIRNINR